MYTQEQINNDRKHYLKEMIENANQLLKDTQGTQLCWEVSLEYSLDKWDKNVINTHRTENQAQKNVEGLKKDGVEAFYRPIVIDSDSGETVTFQNLHYYKNGGYFVKSLNKYLYAQHDTRKTKIQKKIKKLLSLAYDDTKHTLS